MANVKKYNLSGEQVGELHIEDGLLAPKANTQSVKDYLVAIQANARQWSACTQGRSEVNKTKKKPHPQKGTGRARQGFLGATQYKGGGRVHAPKPKFDQHIKINQKERRAAINYLLAEKIKSNKVHVLSFAEMKEPKTKLMASFMKKLEAGKRVLFLYESTIDASKDIDIMDFPSIKYDAMKLSLRNIPLVGCMPLFNVSGYDVSVNHDIVILESAFDELLMLMGGL